MIGRAVAPVGFVCLMLVGLAAVSHAEGYLRPEWQVGQADVTPADLEVTAPPEAPAEMTIHDAVSTALRHNMGFRQTIQSLLSAHSSWQVASQRWDLEAFGSLARSGNGETAAERRAGAAFAYDALTGGTLSVQTELQRLASEETQHVLQASLRQPLIAGAGRASGAYEDLRRARNAYRRALLSFYVSRQALVERVISAYFRAVQDERLAAIQDSSVKLAEETVRQAEVQDREGTIAEIDLLRAKLRLAREKTSAVSQRQTMRDTMDSLLVLLGLQVRGEPKLLTTVAHEPEEVDLEAAAAQALELRPEVWLSRLTLEDREAARAIARNARLPSLDLFGSWDRTTDGVEQKDWRLGVELWVPLGSAALREGARQADWGLLIARQEHEDLQQQIIAEVRSQARAAEAARQNVDIASESLDVARKSLYAAQRLVEEAIRTNRDLLDAQDDLTRNETSLLTSEINYYLASVRLRRAIGLDISQDLPTAVAQPTEEAQPAEGAAPAGEAEPAEAVTPAGETEPAAEAQPPAAAQPSEGVEPPADSDPEDPDA